MNRLGQYILILCCCLSLISCEETIQLELKNCIGCNDYSIAVEEPNLSSVRYFREGSYTLKIFQEFKEVKGEKITHFINEDRDTGDFYLCSTIFFLDDNRFVYINLNKHTIYKYNKDLEGELQAFFTNHNCEKVLDQNFRIDETEKYKFFKRGYYRVEGERMFLEMNIDGDQKMQMEAVLTENNLRLYQVNDVAVKDIFKYDLNFSFNDAAELRYNPVIMRNGLPYFVQDISIEGSERIYEVSDAFGDETSPIKENLSSRASIFSW